MSIFKRPLLAVGVSGFTALCLCVCFSLSFGTAAAVVCAVTGVAGVWFSRFRKAAVCLLCASVAAGMFLLNETTVYRPRTAFDGKTVAVDGIVTESDGLYHGVLAATVKVTGGDLPTDTKLFIRVPFNDLSPEYGDKVSFTAALASETAEKLTLFDSAKADRVFLSGWIEDAKDLRLTRTDSRSLLKTLSALRQKTADALLEGLPQDVRPLLCAMCLGDKSALDNDTVAAFRQSGVSHLLVVSGLHMSIVALGVFGLLRKCRVGRRASSAAALIALWLFALLVGFHPSVVRACILNTLVLSGNLFHRRADGLNSLGGGLLILWLVNPYCVYDVGLWLSFGATYGLLRLLPLMNRGCKRWFVCHPLGVMERPARFVASSLCVTFSATLPILPICALVFGEISLVAPLTNLLAVFPATLLLWSAAAGLFFKVCCLGFFAGAFRLIATLLGRYLLWITSLCGGLPSAVWNTEALYRRVWVVVSLVLCVLLWKRWGKKASFAGVAGALTVIVLLCTMEVAWLKGKTRLMVKHAYGDTAVVLIQDEEACVILDGGNAWTAAKSVLEKEKRTAVEAVVILDEYRKITRKWNEFDDAIEVAEYRLMRPEDTTAKELSQNGVPVDVMTERLPIFDNVFLETAENSVMVTCGEENVVLCPTEKAKDFLPPLFQAAKSWIYFDDTEDCFYVME